MVLKWIKSLSKKGWIILSTTAAGVTIASSTVIVVMVDPTIIGAEPSQPPIIDNPPNDNPDDDDNDNPEENPDDDIIYNPLEKIFIPNKKWFQQGPEWPRNQTEENFIKEGGNWTSILQRENGFYEEIKYDLENIMYRHTIVDKENLDEKYLLSYPDIIYSGNEKAILVLPYRTYTIDDHDIPGFGNDAINNMVGQIYKRDLDSNKHIVSHELFGRNDSFIYSYDNVQLKSTITSYSSEWKNTKNPNLQMQEYGVSFYESYTENVYKNLKGNKYELIKDGIIEDKLIKHYEYNLSLYYKSQDEEKIINMKLISEEIHEKEMKNSVEYIINEDSKLKDSNNWENTLNGIAIKNDEYQSKNYATYNAYADTLWNKKWKNIFSVKDKDSWREQIHPKSNSISWKH